MKKIIVLFILLAPALTINAQVVLPTGGATQLTYQRGGYGADSVLAIPVADTSGAGATWTNYRKIGRIMVNDADSTLYYHDGVKWKVVGGGGVSDTNFIRNQNAYRQDGNFRINGVGETSGMIVVDEWHLPLVEMLDTSAYGLLLAKVLAPPYDSMSQRSEAWLINASGLYGFSAGRNNRTSLRLFPQYVLDSMTNATGGVITNGAVIEDQTYILTTPPERPSIWVNTGLLNYSVALVNTGSPSVDSSVSNYGIFSLADWRKGTFSNAEAKRYNLVLEGAPNFISGPTMFSKNPINDAVQDRDGWPAPVPGPSMDSFNQDFSVKILGNMVYKNGDEGAGKILTSSADGTVNISDAAAVIGGEGFLQGGNAFGATAELGTTDNHPLEIKANDNVALTVNPDGTVQYTDGTEGDGKILMSSADGTLSAQSPDTLLKGVWRSGVVNDMGTQATLRTDADTITIRSNNNILMQSVGNRMAFNDIVRNDLVGLRFIGSVPSTGSAGAPIIFEGQFPSGATGNRIGTIMRATGSTPTSISVLAIGRSISPINTWVGIADDNWHITAATNNYFIRNTLFQPSSTNWFLYTQNPVKSQLPGNLLLNKVADNGYKLQVGEGGVHVESPDEPEKQLVLTTPFTPGNTADAKGEVGAITWDNDYLYIKTTEGWKRAALSNF